MPQLGPDKGCPKPILPLPRYGSDLLAMLTTDVKAILEIDPLEVARQLTLMEFELFAKVKAYECLDQIWDSHRRKETLAISNVNVPTKRHVPGSSNSDITKIIDHTNKVYLFFCFQEILMIKTADILDCYYDH